MAVKLIRTETDERARSRFHVKMIMGEHFALIEDTKWKKDTDMVRSMKLDVRQIITESNFEDVFATIVEAMQIAGEMSASDAVSCITYPAGSTIVVDEIKQA